MRFLLDEMLSKRIAEGLRKRGIDAVAVTERDELVALDDSQILDVAKNEERVLVTNNVADFRRLHEMATRPGGEGHFGIAYISSAQRRTKGDTGRIVKGLEELAAGSPIPESLIDSEAWVGSN
ncbi:MAG: DUF5615 family PIN-like protein [Solirubrobacterales bacterium]